MKTEQTQTPTEEPALLKSEDNPRVVAHFSRENLLHNYKQLLAQNENLSVLPMIKANAYGHGASWAADALADEAKLEGFGVATLEEGIRLRYELGPRIEKKTIIVFSGTAPFTNQIGAFCKEYKLTPVFSSREDLIRYFDSDYAGTLSYDLKFNTGMNRLGIEWNEAARVTHFLSTQEENFLPKRIFTHLAESNEPKTHLSNLQLDKFIYIQNLFKELGENFHFSIANSGAIYKGKEWMLNEFTQLVRPGISLYGIPAWKGQKDHGLKPVLVSLKAKIIQVRELKKGQKIGYSGMYEVTRAEPLRVATLAYGYADGFLRAGSNQGSVLGRISMDLSTVELKEELAPGDYFEILSEQSNLWEIAERHHTIPYEMLTSLGQRIKRIYE